MDRNVGEGCEERCNDTRSAGELYDQARGYVLPLKKENAKKFRRCCLSLVLGVIWHHSSQRHWPASDGLQTEKDDHIMDFEAQEISILNAKLVFRVE